MVIVLNFVDQS